LEKGYLLSGQDFLWPGLDLNPDFDLPPNFLSRNTAETNVPFGLDINHDFIGKEFVQKSLLSGYKWRGLVCQERGPSPRPGHAVFSIDDSKILGYITSGGPSPSLNRKGIALAYLKDMRLGDEVLIQVSQRKKVKALISETPFI